ncbi:MAG: ferrous iron transport protein A [Actinophytocola sp.]|uniref:FeoA family protein n=1 Tax=Actinophytocola sp. TaxID=1872138 RepID=UPI001325BCB4|nr:ferrous iron transport protein A [Actinophytocola sp.]
MVVLRDCPPGADMTLRAVVAGGRERLRLVELGFVPGARIRVVGRHGASGLVVAVEDTRVALNARTGAALVVEPRP